mmetsp:Transcript_8234/g.15265  ORF Transcript_8234/g.15265 Transcript_8234/m.15265 type:complete len:588 (-) Transcript_8234:2318-4081(-)
MFHTFIAEVDPTANHLLDILDEICEFKALSSSKVRLQKAVDIHDAFLCDSKDQMIGTPLTDYRTGEYQSKSPREEFPISTNRIPENDVTFVPSPKNIIEPEQHDGFEDIKLTTDSGNLVGWPSETIQTIRRNIKELLHESSIGREIKTSLFDHGVQLSLGRLFDLTRQFQSNPLFEKFLAIKFLETDDVDERAFANYRIIGSGGFGEVYAMKRVHTGQMYAVKILQKSVIKQKGAEDLCWNELKSLRSIKSPFVVNLKYAFQSRGELYLVMDLMSGGDLCFHLNKSPTGRFPPIRARFHAAEIMLGLKHLQDLGYVYRDLKPDNVLLSDTGHCKISDLGLAVYIHSPLSGMAGTLGYMPPEMFRRDDDGQYMPRGKKNYYGKAVDWWSFGCVVFEMLVGKCPFRTAAAKQFYEKRFGAPCPGGHTLSYRYATCSMDVEYSSSVFQTEEGKLARDLIQGCLNRDPEKRLGTSEELYYNLSHHPWFTTKLDVNQVAKQQLSPPFIPKRDGINADAIKDIAKPKDKKGFKKLDEKDQSQWAMWQYVSRVAVQEEVVNLLKQEEQSGKVKIGSDMLDRVYSVCSDRPCCLM